MIKTTGNKRMKTSKLKIIIIIIREEVEVICKGKWKAKEPRKEVQQSTLGKRSPTVNLRFNDIIHLNP